MCAFAKLIAFCGFGLLVMLLVTDSSWAQEPAAEKQDAQKPNPENAEKADKPTFAVGESVEVWWSGKYLPGEIVALEEMGWVRVKFTKDGREQTIRQPGDGQWVRKLKAPPVAGKPAAAAGEPANPFAAAEETERRTWTDSTGKFKIDATFAGMEGTNVLLTKPDGKTIKLALAKLSQADQEHVAKLTAKPAEANPFNTAEQVESNVTDRIADWSMNEQVLPQPVDGWSLVPDAVQPAAEALSGKAIGLTSAGGQDRFFESATSLMFDAAKSEALIVMVMGRPGKEREVRLVRCDLKAGKIAGETKLKISGTPMDLSPSGQLLVSLPDQLERNESDKNKIAIYRREAGGLVPVVRWKMGEGIEFAKRFDQLYFLGEDKLLAFSPLGGSVTLWQADQARALWSLKVTAHNPPALSSNRNQFAAVVDGGIGIFSANSGDTLARINTPAPLTGGQLSISPDGKRLSYLRPAAIQVWDLTTGKASHEVWFPRPVQGKSLDWCADGCVLVDRSQLVDLDKRIVLWKYDVTGRGLPLAADFGGRTWMVFGGLNNPYQLFSPTLPDATAKAKGENLTADGVLALKPGSSVSVQVNLPGGKPEDAQKVLQTLTDKLTQQGFTVAANAPFTLEATVTDAGKEEASYRGFGRIGGDKVEVQKYDSTATLKENGKEIWTAKRHYGAPHLLRHKEGQALQDAVNEQRGNPNDFFATVELPRQLARHEADGAYGTSKLAP